MNQIPRMHLRIREDKELLGLDLAQMGENAYEYTGQTESTRAVGIQNSSSKEISLGDSQRDEIKLESLSVKS